LENSSYKILLVKCLVVVIIMIMFFFSNERETIEMFNRHTSNP